MYVVTIMTRKYIVKFLKIINQTDINVIRIAFPEIPLILVDQILP